MSSRLTLSHVFEYRIYMSIKAANYASLKQILAETPEIPKSCQWVTFLRNHDELTLEMVTPEERRWMWDEYAPEPRMRINFGIRRRLAPLVCIQSFIKPLHSHG